MARRSGRRKQGLRQLPLPSSILLAIVASLLPNYFGDFCTLMEFGTYRVAIRREEGARRPSRRGSRISEAPSPGDDGKI